MSASLGVAQTEKPVWRKIGNSAVSTGLAGAVGGPVMQVWFSADGSRLFARNGRGLQFFTEDFENWMAAPAGVSRNEPILDRAPLRLPEAKMSLRTGGEGRLYAFGSQVYSSEDSGRTWIDLTAFNGHSVIGEGQHDVAISPNNPKLIAVANDAGVWCSRDGGLSWTGLNENFPNLAVRSLLPENGIFVEGLGTARYNGHNGWVLSTGNPAETALRTSLSLQLGTSITTVAGAGDYWYAGASDGRIWTSTDSRVHWTPASIQAAGAIERFSFDPEASRIAFAAANGRGAHLFRTVNGGQTWDDITGNLANTPAHGIAADRAGDAVYVATDRGVFLSRMDLNALGAATPWVDVSVGLPDRAAVQDVRLEQAGRQLRIAVDGWGVYVTRAPHAQTAAKVVNAADLSTRAAAPGGLVSAIGIDIDTASAAGRQFPVLAHSAEGSQIQIPFEVDAAEVQLRINQTVESAIAVKPVSPAIFVDREGRPLLLDPATGMMLDTAQPAMARASVQVLATGLGRVTPNWPSGMPAPAENTPVVAAEVRAYLNGMPVEVVQATLAPGYVGMYLVEIRLPSLLDTGLADLYLVAGREESNHVHLAVSY